MKTNVRLIYGDQLSESISSLEGYNRESDIVFMCETWDLVTNVKHHKKKIAFLLSAMRHFADVLQSRNYKVEYIKLNKYRRINSLKDAFKELIKNYSLRCIILTRPGSYSLLKETIRLRKELDLNTPIPIEIREDTRFLCNINEFSEWKQRQKSPRMEYFYRRMRKKYNILMDNNNKPVGGHWNYDIENRGILKKGQINITCPQTFKVDSITREVLDLVSELFSNHFGDLEPFYFAVNRQNALSVLYNFIDRKLCYFGKYQDIMITGEPWIYHSQISFYLNVGLLLPMECIHAAEAAYRNNKSSISSVEGFVRQILGWREYIRGIYWTKMPEYIEGNFLDAKRTLPKFYWTAKTKMNCLRQCVLETKQNAYAHHIQRLMVLGNFALLTGLNPKDVNEWFLVVYADAHEWVELPNVMGMVLFADGGYLGSKPYAASGRYINRMSNYCKECIYNVTEKIGKDACPFNYLYWNFLNQNQKVLRKNYRLKIMYKQLDRMSEKEKKEIFYESRDFLKAL